MSEPSRTGRLTHVDESGAARMVDVSGKDVTARTATASGRVLVSAEVVALLRGEGVPKGDALAVARVAGIMAAKQTPSLVPLCHPLAISGVTVDLAVADDAVEIRATVRTTDRTGVEMEALTAVSVAALTVVDMVKAVDKGAVITDVRVESKTGGKSGDWSRVTGSMSLPRGGRRRLQPRGRGRLRGRHRTADRRRSWPSSASRSARRSSYPTVSRSAPRSPPRRRGGARVVLTTGGTGLTPTDRTPEVTRAVLDFEVPGIAEAIRPTASPRASRRRCCPAASRGSSASCLVVNLPGSRGGVKDGLAVLRPMLVHAVEQVVGSDH